MLPETIQLIDITLIDPNPHEPRLTVRDEAVCSIADSIFASGLEQPIRVRPAGDRFETAYGQLRILAFHKLHALRWRTDTKGSATPNPAIINLYFADGQTTRIPAIVREMSDIALMRASLSENALREPLPWMDETRAIRHAIDLGLAQQNVAQMLGVSPANVSQRLRILRMPDSVHALIQDGRLAWTNARLLLPFVHATHVHERELEAVVSYLEGQGEQLNRSRIDHAIDLILGSFRDTWRRLRAGGRDWIVYPDCFHAEPLFDVDAFEAEYADNIHSFTIEHYEDVWTCNALAWDTEQDRENSERRALFAVQPEPAAAHYEDSPSPSQGSDYDGLGDEHDGSGFDPMAPEIGRADEDLPWSAEREALSSGNSGEPAQALSSGKSGDTDAIWHKPIRTLAQCNAFTTALNAPHYHVEWLTRFDRQTQSHKTVSPPFATLEEVEMYLTNASWRSDEGIVFWIAKHEHYPVAA